jgi:hypothetical protein
MEEETIDKDLNFMLLHMRELRDEVHGELHDFSLNGCRYVTVSSLDVKNAFNIFKMKLETIFTNTKLVEIQSIERIKFHDDCSGQEIPIIRIMCSIKTGEYGLFHSYLKKAQQEVLESFYAK